MSGIKMGDQHHLYVLHYRGKQMQQRTGSAREKKFVYFTEADAKRALEYLPDDIDPKYVTIETYFIFK